MINNRVYPCPCCGYVVFTEAPGSYDICEVCGWEDDLSQLRFPTTGGGANQISLIDSQRDFTRTDTHRPTLDWEPRYARDPEWRPLNLAFDPIEEPTGGFDYGPTYSDDPATYYYWRTSRTTT